MNTRSFTSAKSFEGSFSLLEGLPSAFALIIALCLLLGGEAAQARITPGPTDESVSAAESPSSAATSESEASQGTAMIPVEQAASNIVMSDPKRYARAFANGPVGEPETSVASKSTALARLRGKPPGPDDRIPEESIGGVTSGSVRVSYLCGVGKNTLVRIEPGNVRKTLPTPAICSAGQHSLMDSGLLPHARYCYELSTATDTVTSCATTLYRPYLFNGSALSQAESDQMVDQFDWRKTNPVMATVSTPAGVQPTLYSMSILVKSEDDLYSIRGLGIHTQTQPLFSEEKEVWDGTTMHAM
ncbi:MAG: hypothetical protein LUQ11_10380 [Methylococcaceae bacterium]|nr:hypothetical protein [Methylococcaceae bacterium]